MLRGTLEAKIDAKGRLKIPTSFRRAIEETYGTRFFITSVNNGASARIYPLPVWEEIEGSLLKPPVMKPEKTNFLDHANYWGQEAEMDKQGRVLIHQRLRDAAKIAGEVAVVGKINHLEIWNHEILRARLENKPFTDENAEALSQLGI